jgi:hypothetical protein
VETGGGGKTVTLATHQALLGKPRTLVLNVSSSARDVTMTVVLQSHFQRFEKDIVIPASDSPAPIRLSLEGLTDWRHAGGENDGIVRPPLRLVGLRIGPFEQNRETKIHLGPIEIETLADPGEEVLLYGRGRVSDHGRAEFRLFARSLFEDDLRIEIPWRLGTFEGVTLDRGRLPAVLRGGAVQSEATVTADIGDLPFAEMEFEVPLPSGATQSVRVTATRPFVPVEHPKADPSSIFGMGLYLYRYPNTEEGFRQMDRAAALAAAAGVKWSREEFNWGRIEPKKGEFRWEFYDRMVETAARHGITVYGLLAYWSPWTEPFTEQGIEDYCRFARGAVERYRGRIRHWEVWNEPNIFFWDGPKEQYPRLLEGAYRTIKEANPNALVLGCSTSGIDLPFIRTVIKQGGPFDILTVHPYRRDLNDAAFIAELEETRSEVSSLMGREVPVWITEMGWPTQIGGLTERAAASRLARVYLDAAASGAVGNVSWYDFRNDGESPLYNEANFGVLYHDLAPKPAYRALGTVCRTLAGLRVRERLDWGDGILAYHFSGKGRDVITACSVKGDHLICLERRGETFQVRNIMGSPAALDLKDNMSLIWLKQGNPIFIESDVLPVVLEEGCDLSVVAASGETGESVVVQLRLPNSIAGAVRYEVEADPSWRTGEEARSDGGVSAREWRLDAPEAFPAGTGEPRFTLILEAGGSVLPCAVSVTVVPRTLDI